jgi:F-type H+-transporting ATPase subunit b
LRLFLDFRRAVEAARFSGLALLAGGLMAPACAPALQPSPPVPQTEARKVISGQTPLPQDKGLPTQPRQVQVPPLTAQPGQVKQEEGEEENLYRHTPLVQSISDTIFHDNPHPTNPEQIRLRAIHIEWTARTFEWINTAIILLCIIIPVARFLPRVIRKRSSTLNQNLENARKTAADANARLSAVEAQMSRLDEEIAKIRAQVEEESKQDEARIKATIEEERARIVASAQQEIDAAAAHARRNLRCYAADIAIEQAASQMVLTPDTDRALIAEFISQVQQPSANGAHGAAPGGMK